MGYKIEQIEGIGPAFGEKLATAKIATTDDLLDLCCTPNGRKEIAEKISASTGPAASGRRPRRRH